MKHWVKAAEEFPVVVEDDMLRKSIDESSEPLVGRLGLCQSGTAKISRINRHAAKSGYAGEWGGWGRLSEDGPGQKNPDRSEGPWGRAETARAEVPARPIVPDTEQGNSGEVARHEGRWQTRIAGKAPSDIPAFKPYRGKPAVRNFRGDDGNVGIIRSPVRAIVSPDRE